MHIVTVLSTYVVSTTNEAPLSCERRTTGEESAHSVRRGERSGVVGEWTVWDKLKMTRVSHPQLDIALRRTR